MVAALPDGPRGRALALALLGGLLLLGWLGLAAPLLALHSERAEEIAARQAQARRLEALAEALPALRQAAATRGAEAGAPALLGGGTDAIAGATLQELVHELAARAGASLASVETLPATDSGAYRRIGLRVALAAPWPVLVRLLQAMEGARPHMLLDELELHHSQIVTDTGDALMNAAFAVYAFRGEAEAAARSSLP